MLEILSHENQEIEKVLSEMPKGFSTPEINIPLNEGEQHTIIHSLQQEAHLKKRLKSLRLMDYVLNTKMVLA